MLKHRIIPIVLINGFSVLKTQRFDERRNLGSPITVMTTYNTRNVDELVILDIDATRQGRNIDHFTVREITKQCFMPLTVGGGIKTCSAIETTLRSGADKISINTAAIKDRGFVREAVKNFGSQCIVASVDVKLEGGKYCVYSSGGVVRDLDILEYCKELDGLGVGEFLVNDVDKDGLMSGPNFDLARQLTASLHSPVIYAGGVGKPTDCCALIDDACVDAVGVSSIFHFTDYTPEDCRKALHDAEIPARRGL